MITDETISDYRDIIKWSDNVLQRLDMEELLGLLSECIGDEDIDKEVQKYIEEYNIFWHKSAEAIACLGEIKCQMKKFEKISEG